MLGALLIVVSMSTLICVTAAAPLPTSITSSPSESNNLIHFQRAITPNERSKVNAYSSSIHAYEITQQVTKIIQNNFIKLNLNLVNVTKTVPNSIDNKQKYETNNVRTIVNASRDLNSVNELNLESENDRQSTKNVLNGLQWQQQQADRQHRDQSDDRTNETTSATNSIYARKFITPHNNHTSVFLDYLNKLRTQTNQTEIDFKRHRLQMNFAYRRNLSRSVRSLQSNERMQRKQILRNSSRENSDRHERSANLSLTKATKRIQIYIKNRILQVLPDGNVNGSHEDNDYSKYTISIYPHI